jgi:hypothetical protein
MQHFIDSVVPPFTSSRGGKQNESSEKKKKRGVDCFPGPPYLGDLIRGIRPSFFDIINMAKVKKSFSNKMKIVKFNNFLLT